MQLTAQEVKSTIYELRNAYVLADFNVDDGLVRCAETTLRKAIRKFSIAITDYEPESAIDKECQDIFVNMVAHGFEKRAGKAIKVETRD